MIGLPLTAEEDAAAKANWARMPQDMRAFVTELVEAGAMDGRRGLAQCRIAIHPDRLPTGDGVHPCIPTREEREAIEAIRNKGKRA